MCIRTGSWDKTAKVWDATTGTEALTLTLKGHTDSVAAASFSPDGSRVVTASSDGTAKVWDAKSGAEVLTLKDGSGSRASTSFSPDGPRIVTTGNSDGSSRVWDSRAMTDRLLESKKPR